MDGARERHAAVADRCVEKRDLAGIDRHAGTVGQREVVRVPALVPDNDRHRTAVHLDAYGLEPVVGRRHGDRSPGYVEGGVGCNVGGGHACGGSLFG